MITKLGRRISKLTVPTQSRSLRLPLTSATKTSGEGIGGGKGLEITSAASSICFVCILLVSAYLFLVAHALINVKSKHTKTNKLIPLIFCGLPVTLIGEIYT